MENCVAATPGLRDRISELPEPLLHHILSFLSQKESVQTCVLSKSWRYLGPTRPNLVFLPKDCTSPTFLSVVDNTLHRYHDQKLCVQDFHVKYFTKDRKSIVLVEKKLIPFIFAMMGGVKTCDLSFGRPHSRYFGLPSSVFENSDSLLLLSLCGFRFSQKLPKDKVHLKHLQTLKLENVHIADETFHNIMFVCRYIEHLHLFRCTGLTIIRLRNNNHLKSFYLYECCEHGSKEDHCFVDVPDLESMSISRTSVWFNIDRDRKMYFPGLKSLELCSLELSERPSLDILSCDFPSLQDFYVDDCTGFGQLQVSSRSVKRLTLSALFSPLKVVVDAPNLEQLDYSCSSDLDIFFATASDVECVSKMEPRCDVNSEDGFLELHKLLEAVSQFSSKIHLEIPKDDENRGNGYDDYCGDEDEDDYCGFDDIKPVPLECLNLDYEGYGYFYSWKFLNRMFRYCRPRNILERHCSPRSRFLCKMLVLKENKGSPYFWQRDLEEASMELWDHNSEEWHSFEGITFLESDAPSTTSSLDNFKHHEVCFKLNWRE